MVKMLILIHFITCVAVYAVENAPEVMTNQGILRGSYRKTWEGKTFRAFTGIPYAKPPVGELRFKVAVPAEPWKGVLDASKPHAICTQIDIFFNDFEVKGDEDCLFLNVYAPLLTTCNDKLPVMFFIHGGGFTSGGANADLYGPDILLDKDVILVTANYRLGSLGFLSTEDEVVSGNNGLKDQNLALRWVKENIANFGGDSKRITVFGQSAGGASTHYHVLSPLSKDLIFAAIAQSGVSVAKWALAPKGEVANNTKRLAEFLNCPTASSREMVECMRKVDAYDIVEQDKKFMEWSYDPIAPFKPVVEPDVENAFLTEDPVDIMKSGNFAQVPFMMGITTEDGAIKSAAIYNNSNLVEELNSEFCRIAPIMFRYEESANRDNISRQIREFYFGDRHIDSSTKSEVTNMFTDAMFMAPQDHIAELHVKSSKRPVYYYLFGYRGSVSIGPFYGDPDHDYGVVHCDEQIYQLSSDLFDDYTPNEAEKKMNAIMNTLWVNFARTGNPTPETSPLIQTKWEPICSGNLDYYFIKGENDIGMIKNPYVERSNFWNNLPIGFQTNED